MLHYARAHLICISNLSIIQRVPNVVSHSTTEYFPGYLSYHQTDCPDFMEVMGIERKEAGAVGCTSPLGRTVLNLAAIFLLQRIVETLFVQIRMKKRPAPSSVASVLLNLRP